MHKPGSILHFFDDDTTIMVVMSNETGVRYFDPLNPEVDDEGNIKTEYISNKELHKVAWCLSSIEEVARRSLLEFI